MPTPERTTNRLYTGKTLLQLFMVCAFPLHLWTLLMAFRDFGWVALRTDLWDALGLLAYALAVALFESIVVFAAALLLGLLVPWGWSPEKRAALIGTLYLLLAGWSIAGKTFALYGLPIPDGLLLSLAESGHPLRLVWGAVLPLVILSIAIPAAAFVRSPKVQAALGGLMDRLVLLSSLYVGLDLLGLVVILLRNLPGGELT